MKSKEVINTNYLTVLFVTHTLGMSGANRSMFQLMVELRDRHQVRPIVVCPLGKDEISIIQFCDKENIPYIQSKYYWFKGKKRWRQFCKIILNMFLYYPILLYRLRNISFDLVHSNVSVMDAGGFISKFRGKKHIWHLREFGMQDFGLSAPFGKIEERLIYGMGDCFIAISESIRQAFLQVIPSSKVKLIYNGIKCQSKPSCKSGSSEKIQFVMVGIVDNAKNQFDALRAIDKLVQRTDSFHLHIIGKICDEQYYQMLLQYIQQKELTEWVTFWGERKDVDTILSRMDVGLMLSNCEAFGRVTVEYMMHGLAVIASNTGANPEIITDGFSGFLYESKNLEQLVDQMYLLIDHEDIRCSIANKGMEVSLSRFTSIRNTDAVFETYLQVLNDRFAK